MTKIFVKRKNGRRIKITINWLEIAFTMAGFWVVTSVLLELHVSLCQIFELFLGYGLMNAKITFNDEES